MVKLMILVQLFVCLQGFDLNSFLDTVTELIPYDNTTSVSTEIWITMPTTIFKTDPTTTLSPPITSKNQTSFDGDVINKHLNIKTCGIRMNNPNQIMDTYDTFIVGGQQSLPNSWPWMVGIYRNERFLCGGSIINGQHILTAAHCISKGFVGQEAIVPVEQLKVLIGAHYLVRITRPSVDNNNTSISTPSPNITLHDQAPTRVLQTKGGFLAPVSKVIPHYNYSTIHMQNDIAILRLNSTLNFDIQHLENGSTKFYHPICLPTIQMDQKEFQGYNSTIIGWGHQREGGSITETLHEVHVPIISNEKCREAYGEHRIGQQQICAADQYGGRDSCQGDSGGPLTIIDMDERGDERYYQLGIVSWGKGCARPNSPGVYTRVSKYVDWILEQIQDQTTNQKTNYF